MKTLRRFLDSCRLERGDTGGEFSAVHRELSGGAPTLRPSPQLRGRIMEALRESESPRPAGVPFAWGIVGAAVLLTGALMIGIFARPQRPAPAVQFSGLPIPVDAGPVMRLVAGSVDKPLLDQAHKMYDDTRRATRLVASCVPFAKRGG